MAALKSRARTSVSLVETDKFYYSGNIIKYNPVSKYALI